MNTRQMKNFVINVAKREHVIIEWIDSEFLYVQGAKSYGYAYPMIRTVSIARKGNTFTRQMYWTTLHEIGHIIRPGTLDDFVRIGFMFWSPIISAHSIDFSYKSYKEVIAWKYAFEVSRQPPNRDDIERIQGGLRMYFGLASDCSKVWEFLGI